jgi:hypothetical protein
MDKVVITSVLCLFLSTVSLGQNLKKQEARKILETAYSTLKTGDSTTFVNLWYIDGTAAPYHKKSFTEKTARTYFHYLREFLDTALILNLPIHRIDISKVDPGQQKLNFGKYNIKAWFKYTENYQKGFGLFIDYCNEKWVVRYIPETSTQVKIIDPVAATSE